jgi:hypothetical protein
VNSFKEENFVGFTSEGFLYDSWCWCDMKSAGIGGQTRGSIYVKRI